MGRDCKYCVAYISDMVNMCPACGKRVRPEKTPEYDTYNKKSSARTGDYSATGASASAKQEQKRTEWKAEEKYSYTYNYETAKSPSAASRPGADAETDAGTDKLLALLCYLGPLFLIPYLTRRDSDFIRFHSNQGLLLLIADIVIGLASLLFIIGGIVGAVGRVFIIICFIKGIISVLGGKKEPLPVIGNITLLK
jgi:uncharacterized membrane protein